MIPLIEAKYITKTMTYGDSELMVLQRVCFQMFSNESIAITGASGCGKSTLLHVLGALDLPTAGELFFFGQKHNPQEDSSAFRNKNIGFIFQNFYLLEDDSVLNNVLMPARIAREKTGPRSFAYQRALFLLDSVGLIHKKSVKCSVLSGGEKQRVAIARALMNDPNILLADEPSGNLDEHTSETIHELLLAQVNESRGILIVTHDKQLAQQCSRRCVLHHGNLFFD